MNDPNELVERYVAVWNEPDPDRRGRAVTELWTEDGAHLLQPPQEMVAAGAALRMNAVLEARGHRALESRVARAYEEFIAPGDFLFRVRDAGTRVHDLVKFRWEMVARANGEVAAVGLELLVLDADERIRLDYQFIEA